MPLEALRPLLVLATGTNRTGTKQKEPSCGTNYGLVSSNVTVTNKTKAEFHSTPFTLDMALINIMLHI